ncbi:radical SAM protein [Aliidiomarina minuta]|uniref:Radical SAM protein n=1 Tax=Aliidiomarina minuta TaxID=880057 RepID=A0A432W5W9_9GAMM|nr:radical SAM protein [Aliidiomarina minuta]RUO25470.1 radical SAM protein [Aliidiomarina minuta]
MSTQAQVIKFFDPYQTAQGEPRASVALKELSTLWFNTGTRCNLACANCYIESSPDNDRLSYLTLEDVVAFLDEIQEEQLATTEIGLTGGEPFINPHIIPIMQACLERGFKLLILTNAMTLMTRRSKALLELQENYGELLTMRVSVDHFKIELHEEERGPGSWKPMLHGLQWLSEHGFNIDVAGRTRWGEKEDELRAGFAEFFAQYDIDVDAYNQQQLVLFPEMDENADVPEITTACWGILGVNPDDMMCASSRMVVKHKGDDKASVMACTLLAYDPQFNLGHSLKEASQSVQLNHRHCAKFCVLGGGSCSVSD